MALRVYKEGNKIIYSDDTFDKVLEDKASEVDVFPAPSAAGIFCAGGMFGVLALIIE